MSSASAKQRFQAAYRMARIAFRGRQRVALQLDLQMEPDYSPDCRRCNAGVKVVEKVVAAIGWGDGPNDITVALNAQAVKYALGEPAQRQRGAPSPLDFDGWMERRRWFAEYQAARTAGDELRLSDLIGSPRARAA